MTLYGLTAALEIQAGIEVEIEVDVEIQAGIEVDVEIDVDVEIEVDVEIDVGVEIEVETGLDLGSVELVGIEVLQSEMLKVNQGYRANLTRPRCYAASGVSSKDPVGWAALPRGGLRGQSDAGTLGKSYVRRIDPAP